MQKFKFWWVPLIFQVGFINCDWTILPESELNTTELIKKNGYTVEEHEIKTEDGYVLKTHRIPCGYNIKYNGTANKYPILLVHGLGGSSDNFITLGSDLSLAYVLANGNFDVWLMNSRGNFHSRKHIILNPDLNKEYWNFSWHEIGIYDIPANIDYIIEKTGSDKVSYIGHSQGSTAYFVMTSEKPEYNDKIRLHVSFGPPVLLNLMTLPLAKYLANNVDSFENIFEALQLYEMVPLNENLKYICAETPMMKQLCSSIHVLIGGHESGLFNPNITSMILKSAPAGCSIYQVLHYLQIVKDSFSKYNYGKELNYKKYGQKVPPAYNLSISTAPAALFFGRYDIYASKEQVDVLSDLLPNIVMKYEVPYERYNHVDFIWSEKSIDLVYKPLYKLLLQFQKG